MKTVKIKEQKSNTVDRIILNTFLETLSAKQRKILKQVSNISPISLKRVKVLNLGYRLDTHSGEVKLTEQLRLKIIEAYKISSFTYSESEFQEIWYLLYQDHYRSLKETNYRAKPRKEGRDNKDVRVGSGGSSSYYSSIRFPKKTANKSVWKKFWKLFPFLQDCKSWKDYHLKEAKKNETI